MRQLTVVQLVGILAVLGSGLAVFVPAFLNNLRASRLAEPMNGLARIGASATRLALSRPFPQVYPETAPLTPSEVPAGTAAVDPEGTWSHATWQALGFSFEQAHYYSFAFESVHQPQEARFLAFAIGDLDGDGKTSRFELSGVFPKGGQPAIYPLELRDEIE